MVIRSFESFFVPSMACFLVHQRVRLLCTGCSMFLSPYCLLVMFLLLPLAMVKCRYGSKVQTAFGGILTRSTILIERSEHVQNVQSCITSF
jgi:hypothetical protein